MKRSFLIAALLCPLLLGSLVGCRPLVLEGGALVFVVPGQTAQGRTVSPSREEEISYCNVHGSGPGAASFTVPGVAGSTIAQNSLAAGLWTITVDAFNSSDELIGSGSVGVTIESGRAVSASVQVSSLAGTGILAASVSWPSGTIGAPAIQGTLTPAGGTPQDIEFTVDADSASFTSAALDEGYYLLTLRLADGTGVEWGSIEAVRILSGLTTTAAFDLSQQDLFSGG
jgi:hypothetical protein